MFNNTYFSHILEYILEYINIPLNFFNFMLYTSIHYINYSYFHINNFHELHHKDTYKNIGPDICDIIFGTKYKIENSNENTIENTDHYIPNILISLLIFSI